MEVLFWIILPLFLVIVLLGFWLTFRFNRSQFRETLTIFLLGIFTLILSDVIFNLLKNAGKRSVRGGWRETKDLIKISFLLALFLVVLLYWIIWILINAFLSFLKRKRRKRRRRKKK